MAECLTRIPIRLKEPIEIKGAWRYEISVPCGKCARCLERRKMEWGFRMGIELEASKTAYFVTLTYDQENVPYNRYGIKTLKPKNLTDFFKRLRQNQRRGETTIEHLLNGLRNTDRIKYYAAGEYGEQRGRPHYHAIIFNTAIKYVESSWQLGGVHVVKANEMTIAYVMKYLDKHKDKKQDKRKVPEYNVMSEEIGMDYVYKMREWHKRNIEILYVTSRKGIRVPMPKYYREKIFSEDERKAQVMIVESKMEELKNEQVKEYGQDLYNTIKNRELKYTEAKFKKGTKKRIID